MKLLIADNDDDRRALLALAGLSPPDTTTPPLIAVPDLPTLESRHVEAEAVNLDADPDADDAEAAVRVSEPSGGPFEGHHTDHAPVVSQPHSQPPGIKCPPGVDELSERMFETYCFLFDRYRAEGGVHYRAYARSTGLKVATANSRLHRLVERGLAENPGGNGIYRAVVEAVS